jgi:cysteine-rich repeat protein
VPVTRWRSPRRAAVSVAQSVCLLAVLTLARNATAAFDAADRGCIAGVAEALLDATTVSGTVSSGCIAALFTPADQVRSPFRSSTIADCVASSPIVWRRRQATKARSSRLCVRAYDEDPNGADPKYEFGLRPGDAASAGVDGLTDLLRDVFGLAPEPALRAVDTARARTCQRSTWAAARICTVARQRDLVSCLRDGLADRDPIRRVDDVQALRDRCLGKGSDGQPDTHGSIARSCSSPATGLAAVLARSCEGQDLAAMFPGCAGESATAGCIERKVACRTCLTVNRALGTTRNCDRFDDGADDGSCGCGDGIRTPFEECDDGNDVETDGCTTSCTEGPAYCPCYTEADIDTAFPPDFFAPSESPACIDDQFGAGFTSGICLLPAPRAPPFHYPRLGAGVMDGICFFQPTPLSDEDGGWCQWPDFTSLTGADIEACRNVMRRSQAWQRECGR